MAQILAFNPWGAIEIKANTEYTSVDIPVGVNVIILNFASWVLGYLYDKDGKKVVIDNIPQRRPTKIRGVRVLIENSGVSYPKTNVPMVWEVGQEIVADVNSTYTFLDDGIVVYGTRVAV